MCWDRSAQILSGRVAPFGYPRLGSLDSSPRLFAVLPRPSSALNAKSSTMYPYPLDLYPEVNITYSVVNVLSTLKGGSM